MHASGFSGFTRAAMLLEQSVRGKVEIHIIHEISWA
jgi:hypothetical protein